MNLFSSLTVKISRQWQKQQNQTSFPVVCGVMNNKKQTVVNFGGFSWTFPPIESSTKNNSAINNEINSLHMFTWLDIKHIKDANNKKQNVLYYVNLEL